MIVRDPCADARRDIEFDPPNGKTKFPLATNKGAYARTQIRADARDRSMYGVNSGESDMGFRVVRTVKEGT